jgi:hypothetical protein
MNNKNSYNYLDPSFSLHKGSLVVHKGNSFEHELAKFLVYWEETRNGNTVISEARFNNGSRADLYLVKTNKAIEIVHSESDKSIDNKRLKYPCDVIKLESSKIINFWLDKLNKERLK